MANAFGLFEKTFAAEHLKKNRDVLLTFLESPIENW